MKTLKKILFFLLTMENAHVICLKAMSSTPISPTMCLRRRDTNNDRVVQIIQVKEKQQQGQKYLIPSASEARKHLKNGVNPNINNFEGRTALHNAVIHRKENCVQALLSARNLDVEEIENKLERIDIDAQDYMQFTALHWAAITEQDAIVRLLINAQANLNIHNYQGKTALDLAMSVSGYDCLCAQILRVAMGIKETEMCCIIS